MNFGSKHVSISDASLAFSRRSVYLFCDCQWFKEICFKKWLHVLMQFGKLLYKYRFIRKKSMKILKICLRIFLIAINIQHFSNESEFCL